MGATLKNKRILEILSSLKTPDFSSFSWSDFLVHKFQVNNLRILLVSVFLVIEQLILGFFVSEPGSVAQIAYFLTAAVCLFYVFSSIYFYEHEQKRINPLHNVYEFSFPLLIMGAVVFRFLIIDYDVQSVPTVYISALYGIAVVFIFNLYQGLILYSLITISSGILMRVANPDIMLSSYLLDVIINVAISWFVLFINYRRFQYAYWDKKNIESINIAFREQSFRDSLTGLYNRRKLDEVYGEVCTKASRYNLDFALMIIDIDNFKLVNDRFGHHVGDKVLIEFSRILENNIREVDVCGRWGGEEFLVICQETEINAAYNLAERLRDIIETNVFNSELKITASFGISSWSECSDPTLLINTADARLYQSKAAGRNKVTAGHLIKKGIGID